MDISEQLLRDIDSKLDLLIQREDYRDVDVVSLKEAVFGSKGDNGLRLRVRLLEETNKQAKWALKIAIAALIASAALGGWNALSG